MHSSGWSSLHLIEESSTLRNTVLSYYSIRLKTSASLWLFPVRLHDLQSSSTRVKTLPDIWHRHPLVPVLGRGVQGFLGYVSSVFSAGSTCVYEAVCVRLASHSWLERNHTSLQLQSHHGTHLQITRITSYSCREIWHNKPSSRDQQQSLYSLTFKRQDGDEDRMWDHLWRKTVASVVCNSHISYEILKCLTYINVIICACIFTFLYQF